MHGDGSSENAYEQEFVCQNDRVVGSKTFSPFFRGQYGWAPEILAAAQPRRTNPFAVKRCDLMESSFRTVVSRIVFLPCDGERCEGKDTSFFNCQIVFDGPANNTVQFLRGIGLSFEMRGEILAQ